VTQHFVYSAIAGALIEVSPREVQQFRAAHDAHYAATCAERFQSQRLRVRHTPPAARVFEVAGGPEQAAGCELSEVTR
jgi:hypothetical protein